MKWHVRLSIMFLVITLVLSACGASKTAEAPITIEEWRNETQNRSTEFTREGDHYWRYVPGGTYTIGGWTDDDVDHNDAQADVALEEYWVARYPVTVQQYRAFIEDGGYDTEEYWTPNGWEWKVEEGRTQPTYWGDHNRFNVDDNQPVVGVTWYESAAFANWLNNKLGLPAGTIHLPTEAEWEVACAYDTNGQRHPYPWGEQELTQDLADFGKDWNTGQPAPVGGRPAGAAASGAQDMVGSVREWGSSDYQGYPAQSARAIALPVPFFTIRRFRCLCASDGRALRIKQRNIWFLSHCPD